MTRATIAALVLLGLAGIAAAGRAEPAVSAEPARYVEVWGPAVGSELPLLDADDQSGRRRALADLCGDQGLLLFLIRSADW